MRVQLEWMERELEDRVADGALIRVEEVILIEIQTHEANRQSEEGQEQQEPAKRPRRRSRLGGVGRGAFA